MASFGLEEATLMLVVLWVLMLLFLFFQAIIVRDCKQIDMQEGDPEELQVKEPTTSSMNLFTLWTPDDPVYQNTKTSEGQFGRLPQELRDIIYELALIDDSNIVISRNRGSCKGVSSPTPSSCGLLKVSKVLQKETLPIYYGKNVFAVTSRLDLYNWLRVLGSTKRSMLKEVQVSETIEEHKFWKPDCYRAWQSAHHVDVTLRSLEVPLQKGVCRFWVDNHGWADEVAAEVLLNQMSERIMAARRAEHTEKEHKALCSKCLEHGKTEQEPSG